MCLKHIREAKNVSIVLKGPTQCLASSWFVEALPRAVLCENYLTSSHVLLNLNQQLTVFWPQMASVSTLRKKKSTWQLCCDFDKVIDYIKDSLCLLKSARVFGSVCTSVAILQSWWYGSNLASDISWVKEEVVKKQYFKFPLDIFGLLPSFFDSNLHSKLNDFKLKYIHDAFPSLRD